MHQLTLLFAIAGLLIGSTTNTHAQSQAEMNTAASGELEAAHAKLNSIYKKVLASKADDKQFCADLKEAQRAWVKYMEFHMKTRYPVKEGENPTILYGSEYHMDLAAEQTEMINARCKELSDLLNN